MKIVQQVASEMTIKDIAELLQKRIDIRMKSFSEHYDRMKAINMEVEELEKKMYAILVDLEPVESLIYSQNPKLERMFNSLKNIYGKVENGIDREANE